MKETSNIYGNSASQLVSDRIKVETELSKPPKPNNQASKILPSVKPIFTSKSALSGPVIT